jgi:hypothetical protein
MMTGTSIPACAASPGRMMSTDLVGDVVVVPVELGDVDLHLLVDRVAVRRDGRDPLRERFAGLGNRPGGRGQRGGRTTRPATSRVSPALNRVYAWVSRL